MSQGAIKGVRVSSMSFRPIAEEDKKEGKDRNGTAFRSQFMPFQTKFRPEVVRKIM